MRCWRRSEGDASAIDRPPDRQSPGMSRRFFLRALHRLHGSAQTWGLLRTTTVRPLRQKRPDSLTPASRLEVAAHHRRHARDRWRNRRPDRPLPFRSGSPPARPLRGHPVSFFLCASSGWNRHQLPATSIRHPPQCPLQRPSAPDSLRNIYRATVLRLRHRLTGSG